MSNFTNLSFCLQLHINNNVFKSNNIKEWAYLNCKRMMTERETTNSRNREIILFKNKNVQNQNWQTTEGNEMACISIKLQ